MIRRPPRSTLFPTRRSSDLSSPAGASSGACSADWSWISISCALFRGCNLPIYLLEDIVMRKRRNLPTNRRDRKSTRLNSSHGYISYAGFCLKKTSTSIEFLSRVLVLSFFFFNDTATTEIYTFPYTTLFRSVQPGWRKLRRLLR